MAGVSLLTSSQFEAAFRAALLKRTRAYDTAYGPLKELFLALPALILEDQNNNRLRYVSLLQSLENVDDLADADIDARVYDEGLTRSTDSRSTTVLTFRRFKPFSVSEAGVIPLGFAVATEVSSTSGNVVTFVTTAQKDKTDVVAAYDADLGQVVYDVTVPAIALTSGSSGVVGPGRLTRALRSLGDYDSVTNKTGSKLALDTATNTDLVNLYLLAVGSRQLSVPSGSEFFTLDNYPDVRDVNEVYGSDPLLTRAGADAGAVDAFFIGETLEEAVDPIPFYGVGQKMYLSQNPSTAIVSVIGVSPATTYVEGTDFEYVPDVSGVSGSVRAHDAIRFLPIATSLPDYNSLVNVTYSYNTLPATLQATADDTKTHVEGRDLLYREGDKVTIYLTATVKVFTGFSPTDIKKLVSAVLIAYINSLGLGDPLELFDLGAQVATISGVDKFNVTKLTSTETSTGAVDLTLGGNEYPFISENTLILV